MMTTAASVADGDARFPARGAFLEAVRDSCRRHVERNTQQVEIDDSAMAKFLDSLDWTRYEGIVATPFRWPLKFDSVEQEVGLLALMDILNFGSGYREVLHRYTGRGAAETIRFGVMSLHITEHALSASLLASITAPKISDIFSVPISKDVPHKTISAVTISEQIPELRSFVEKIAETCREVGALMKQRGCGTLGQFVMSLIQDAKKDGRPSAALFVENLVRALPSMNDHAVSGDDTVFVYKKAQLLAADLYRRFGKERPEVFDFSDADDLTVFADNVLPCVLMSAGVLRLVDGGRLTQSLAASSAEDASSEPRMSIAVAGEDATLLRAAAVVACERMRAVSAAEPRGKTLRAMDLDAFLWHIGKDPALRKVPRFAFQATVFF